MKSLPVVVAGAALLMLSHVAALAHGGGLNSQGCHNKTSDGSYHCHR